MNKYAGPTNRYTELIGGELDQVDKDYVGNESGLLAARHDGVVPARVPARLS